MLKNLKTLDGLYKEIKSAFQSIETGMQLTLVIRYGNDYTNEGQFRKVFTIVKSKGRFRNPDNYRRDWTIKEVVKEIEWYAEHNFHSIEMDLY